MTTIHVWMNNSHEPLIYENVDSYWESFRTLDIVQEDSYITTTTTLYKKHIERFTISEMR